MKKFILVTLLAATQATFCLNENHDSTDDQICQNVEHFFNEVVHNKREEGMEKIEAFFDLREFCECNSNQLEDCCPILSEKSAQIVKNYQFMTEDGQVAPEICMFLKKLKENGSIIFKENSIHIKQ